MRPVTVLLLSRGSRDHNHTVAVILTLIVVLIFFQTVRIASAQPTVQTLPATNVTDTSAVLNGVVLTNGQDTGWFFNIFYPDGGIESCVTSWEYQLPGASGTNTITCPVTGLQPSATYGFQLHARWAGGDWQDGAKLSFTTQGTSSLPMVTQIWTALTFTSTASTSSHPNGAGFDFALSVSPSTVSVVQGGTAHYAASVMYSDPSYAGTMINIQLTGLGQGMDYNLLQSGDLTVTTSPMTPTGSYSIVLTGSANGVTHQTGLTLIVTSAQSGTTAVITTVVPSTAPSTITTSAVITTPIVAVTSVITQTATVQPSSTSTHASTSDVVGLLQQNSLLIIAILVIALAAVLLSRRRGSTGPTTQTQPQTANVTYCSHCGTQNPVTNSYCRKCGTKLQT